MNSLPNPLCTSGTHMNVPSRVKGETAAEPATKRRKLAPSGSQNTQNSSFADVLEQLSQNVADGPCASLNIVS